MKPSLFGIVGGGFRSRIFIEIARALPDRFRLVGMVVRNHEQAQELTKRFGVVTHCELPDLLEQEHPDFMVLSVPSHAASGYLWRLAALNIPTLAETPPAPDLDGLLALQPLIEKHARIQVAEQYRYRPMMCARFNVIQSGRIGAVTETDVSISHGYHGINLVRTFLGVGFAPVQIRAMRFDTSLIQGPDRQGLPVSERLVSAARELAWLNFGEKLGVFDFTQNQHRSWIRKTRISIRGTRGEIQDDTVRYLTDHQHPVELPLMRVERGRDENVEGYFLSGITLGDTWVYQTPFPYARMNDEEIAVATVLTKMAEYAAGGPAFYDLRQACHDQYLALLLQQAIAQGDVVTSTMQPWMRG